MNMNPFLILFSMSLILSLVIVSSTNQPLFLWLSLELNMLSFIPIIMIKKSTYSMESVIKYFIVQTMSSMFIILFLISNMKPSISITILLIMLMIKLAMIPMHQWMISMVEPLTWLNLNILLTIQKILPLIIISFLINSKYNNDNLLNITIIMSAIVTSMKMFSQFSLRKMMAYSSIMQNAWVMTAMYISYKLWLLNFFIYFLIMLSITYFFHTNKMNNINSIMHSNNNSKEMFISTLNLTSLMGLPPSTGFLMKLNVLIMLLKTNYTKILLLSLIMSSIISTYMYMNMMSKMVLKTSKKKNINSMTSISSNIIPLMLLPLIIMFLSI